MNKFKNTNQLFKNKKYQIHLKKIGNHEEKRRFCRHDVDHFLTLARIASIKCFESETNLSLDLIYTTALLHDIGRFMEYEKQIPHEIASYELAIPLLNELHYSEVEKNIILDAILNHRNPNTSGFNHIFYESDKLSRPCFSCSVEAECYWAKEKKNLEINY